jgi:hypothetical protein
MACVAKGVTVSFDHLMNAFELGPTGETSLGDLGRVAQSLGLFPIMARVGPDFAEKIPTPFIAHVKSELQHVDHFVLVMYASRKHVIFIDAPRVAALDSMESFERRWSGNVVAFANSEVDAAELAQGMRLTLWNRFLDAGLAAAFAGTMASTAFVLWRRPKARPETHSPGKANSYPPS